MIKNGTLQCLFSNNTNAKALHLAICKFILENTRYWFLVKRYPSGKPLNKWQLREASFVTRVLTAILLYNTAQLISKDDKKA